MPWREQLRYHGAALAGALFAAYALHGAHGFWPSFWPALLVLEVFSLVCLWDNTRQLARNRRARYLWAPVEGLPHPPGRTDTHPRFTIERSVDEEGMFSLGLAGWRYENVWQREEEWAVEPRLFHPEEWTESGQWENELRERALEKEEQARAQLEEREEQIQLARARLEREGPRELVR